MTRAIAPSRTPFVGPAWTVLLLLVVPVFAGCFVDDPGQVAFRRDAAILDGLFVQRFSSSEGYVYEVGAAAGGLSYFSPSNASAQVVLPPNTLIFDPATGGFSLDSEQNVRARDRVYFILPAGLDTVEFEVRGPEGRVIVIADAPDTGNQIVSGEFMYALMETQRDLFPNRRPGTDTYLASQTYFAEYFESLGMDVEVDPYGTNALNNFPDFPDQGFRNIKPNSVANVVAFKPGTADPPKYLIFGGHYDVVENTVEGAFDNTAGTIAVMELARVFANVTMEHTLVFGLWGGEEDGILGSRFWVDTNRDKIATTTSYFNLDVVGMAYPGPANMPDPVVLTAGPDGPASDSLLGFASEIQKDWMRYDSQFFRYEPWAEGQAQGSEVNAQSDHTSFITAGIPSYFIFAGNIPNIFRVIHSPTDTIHNMTLYMMGGEIGDDVTYTDADYAEGKNMTARGFETQLWFPFYYGVLVDIGYYKPTFYGNVGPGVADVAAGVKVPSLGRS